MYPLSWYLEGEAVRSASAAASVCWMLGHALYLTPRQGVLRVLLPHSFMFHGCTCRWFDVPYAVLRDEANDIEVRLMHECWGTVS